MCHFFFCSKVFFVPFKNFKYIQMFFFCFVVCDNIVSKVRMLQEFVSLRVFFFTSTRNWWIFGRTEFTRVLFVWWEKESWIGIFVTSLYSIFRFLMEFGTCIECVYVNAGTIWKYWINVLLKLFDGLNMWRFDTLFFHSHFNWIKMIFFEVKNNNCSMNICKFDLSIVCKWSMKSLNENIAWQRNV